MAVVYNLKKTLGGSLWKWEDGTEKVFTILGPIRAGKAVASPRSGIAKAPDIMSVRDAADGNDKEILVGAVLKSSLVRNLYCKRYYSKRHSDRHHMEPLYHR
jgi:hypothetical protein